MNTKKAIGLGLVAAGAIAGSLLTDVKSADAFVVHNGWNYSMDAYNDSTTFNKNGDGAFEIRGMAYKVIGEKAYFAINSNVSLKNGVKWNAAADKRVDFGDVLINFTGESLDQANGDLFGIRFAAGNDSGVSELGVYSNVNATSVAGSNNGWNSMNDYNKYVLGQKVTPTIGDLAYNDSYFDLKGSPFNSIKSGTRVGDVEFLSDLSSIGLDFNFFGNISAKSNTIAFTFDSGLLPAGQALYHLAMECNNDIVAGYYDSPAKATDVPTPAAILPVIMGMFGAASRKKNGEEKLA